VATRIEKWASERIPGTKIIGKVSHGSGVVHTPLNLVYDQY